MITARMETITPVIAKKYLEKNTRNYRTLCKSVVDKYAEDMLAGMWEENGETISFYENGDLFDGQHRLNAIVKSGVTLHLMVERGIPNETTITNWGVGRTLKQWGAANKVQISGMTQGIARSLIAGFSRGAVSRGITIKYINEHYDDLRETERLASQGKHHPLGKRAPIGLAVYVIRKLGLVNDNIIEQFFRVFNTGTVTASEARDPSAPLIASREIITKYRIGSGLEAIKGQYEIIIQALIDYKKNVNRKREYKSKEEVYEWFEEVRRMEGFK